MPSPFPGMNPYLERASVWKDFHNAFLMSARISLAAQVDPEYYVGTKEHIYIHEWPVAIGLADAAIAELSRSKKGPSSSHIAVAEPKTFHALVSYPAVEEERLIFLEVRNRDSNRLVTIIELLSPSNKYSGPDREDYLLKRQSLLTRSVNLVELDLLRGGPRMPNRNIPESDYSVLVSRPERRPFSEYWAFDLRDPMPGIPIPLGRDDSDAAISLKAILDDVYDSARYASRIYRGQPEPALSPDDAEWAKQFIPTPS